MRRLAPILLTIAMLLGSAGEVWSANYQKGQEAFLKKDYPTTLREWKPLAEQGDARAQYSLGVMYRDGLGVPQDYKTALNWFRLAAKQGDPSAQFNLGGMYGEGRGVPQNYKTAVKWVRLAAEQGHASAQTNLGIMYGIGQGVIHDNVYAHMWGNLSASNGDENGGKLRDLVAKEMTPTQLKTAQRLARECVRKKYKGC